MTENKNLKTESKNPEKKRQFFLMKFVIIFSLIFASYFGIKYWRIQQDKQNPATVEETGSQEHTLDLAQEHQTTSAEDLADLTVNELKEKGAEFIYQMLLKNQVQIEDLRTQIQNLKGEMVKNKNQEKISKMILVYVDLRQQIFSGGDFSQELKNFEILTSFDENLQGKIAKLKPLLPHYYNQEKLVKSFAEAIPDIIATKKNIGEQTGLIAKIRYNISKLVVIRRIDGKNPQDVDAVIVKIEKDLKEKNYQEALNSALSLDQNYHEVLKDFLDKLSNALEVQKTDQEILNYLKSLT